MSTGEHILRATASGVVVGGSGAAGGWAGAEVGAEIGATRAETGPGALICGGAGALIGGFVGSKVGQAAGSEIEKGAKDAWHGISHGFHKLVSWL